MPESQNINNLIDIFPTLFNDSQLYSSSSKKHASEIVSTKKSQNKKVKKANGKKDKDYSMLKKLIEKLKLSSLSSNTTSQTEYITSPNNFTNLYNVIIKVEK
ncbi:hypothetical protein Glove_508g17 [Diversispora epigaea]|uniref:Uncharacterized protein n=1 Tax=Diversispora epigaea TaxID=1348612 RepID=A0A397GHL6_9GLOM|nr:hypothetical protein Glove_508g17 [Diversispora epigaea]